MRSFIRPLLAFVVLFASVATAQDAIVRPGSGGTVIVLDSTDLRGAGGQTLAAFLAGRVPGVMIAYTSGLASTTPRVISRGTYGPIAAPEPLLYIDGILWKDDDHLTGRASDVMQPASTGGVTPPSVGWGLPIEEVAEIRVHLGLSSGIMLEERGSRGSVHVTTHRPVAGETIVRSSLWTSVQGIASLSEPNHGTVGVIAGASTVDCTLERQVAGTCTSPGARLRWDPALDIMPFQVAQGVRAVVTVQSILGGWPIRAAAVRDVTEGALPGAHSDRTDLAIATTAALGRSWDLALDARYALSRGNRTEWDGSLVNTGMAWAGPDPDDTLRADLEAMIDGLGVIAPRRESDRISLGATARWERTPATSFEFEASQDLLRRASRADWPDTWFIDNQPLTTVARSDLYQRDQSLAARWLHARPIGTGVRLEARAGARYRRTMSNESASAISCCVVDPFFPPSFGASRWSRVGPEFTTLFAMTRLDLRERLLLGLGLRQEALRGVRTSPTMKSAEAAWHVISTGRGDAPLGLTRLVVRGGYGENVDHRIPMPELIFIAGDGPVFETTMDREVAVDATWIERVDGSLSYAVTSVSGGAVGRTNSMTFPFFPTLATADWRVDAILARAAIRSRPGRASPWRVGLSAMSRRPAIRNLVDPASCEEVLGSLLATCHEEGSPLGRPVVAGHTYDDINDDGIIVESEVTVDPAFGLGGHPDPRWVLGLTGDIALWPGIRFGAVVESHLGQIEVDVLELNRCRRNRCEALHDPTAPLDEQAAAIAANVVGNVDFSGFVREGAFVRIRELHLSLAPAFLRGNTVRFAAHQLLAWSRFDGVDPEVRPRRGAIPSAAVGFHQGIRPSFSLRVELAPIRR